MRGLLPRIPVIESLMEFSFDVLVHVYRDPGIVNDADNFLRSYCKQYGYVLVIFDHQGSGKELLPREQIEQEISKKLDTSGWNNRNSVICVSPELENWIWVNEVRMMQAISWEGERLYEWLHRNHLKNPEENKPSSPKEAFEAALRESHTPRSSSLYYSIASRASYKKCEDPAFHKMLTQLRIWFDQNI